MVGLYPKSVSFTCKFLRWALKRVGFHTLVWPLDVWWKRDKDKYRNTVAFLTDTVKYRAQSGLGISIECSAKPGVRGGQRCFRYWSCTELNSMDLGTRKTRLSGCWKTMLECPIFLKVFLWSTKSPFLKTINVLLGKLIIAKSIRKILKNLNYVKTGGIFDYRTFISNESPEFALGGSCCQISIFDFVFEKK